MLRPFFDWVYNLGVYQFPIPFHVTVQLIHLMSLVVFFGGLLVVDLRLLGVGLTTRPVHQVAKDANPWLMTGLLGLILTGIPATMSTAQLQYDSSIWWMKMYTLAAAIIMTFTIRRGLTRRDEVRGVAPKVVAVLSIFLWMSVAALARNIMLMPSDTFQPIVGGVKQEF
jgi:hypothetical protein